MSEKHKMGKMSKGQYWARITRLIIGLVSGAWIIIGVLLLAFTDL